jgi:hypothetical protein
MYCFSFIWILKMYDEIKIIKIIKIKMCDPKIYYLEYPME